MKQKSNIRTCIVTHQKFYKNELVRFVIMDNQIIMDKAQTLPQKGYYFVANLNDSQKIKLRQLLAKKYKITNINEILTV